MGIEKKNENTILALCRRKFLYRDYTFNAHLQTTKDRKQSTVQANALYLQQLFRKMVKLAEFTPTTQLNVK